MFTSIKKIIVLMVLVAAFISCNQGPSLQTYYVDNELKPGFTSIDIPVSILNIEEDSLTEEQLEAYDSVDKLNMLGFIVDEGNRDEYEMELVKIDEILADPKYEELMRGGSPSQGKFIVKFLGDEENIDELIIFGNSTDQGFAVIRVLGDDMNVNKLMSLQDVFKDMNYDNSEFGKISRIFE